MSSELVLEHLEEGWEGCDYVDVMLHAAFQCLVDYIEKANHEAIAWEADKFHRRARREMVGLYEWWKEEYVPAWKAGEVSDVMEQEAQGQLERLVEVRGFLWV